MVPRRDLESAVAINSLSLQVARFIGPAIAGLLLAVAGPTWVFGVNAVSFVAVLGTLAAGLAHEVGVRQELGVHGALDDHGPRNTARWPATARLPAMPELIHTCYRITDIDRSVAFYEALGFEERGRLPIGAMLQPSRNGTLIRGC